MLSPSLTSTSLRRAAAALLAAGALGIAGCGDDPDVVSEQAPASTPASTTPESGSVSGQSIGLTTQVDVDTFAARVDDEAVRVIDVRTPEEYADGHIAGAQLIPVSAPDFDEQIAKLDPDAKYAVYCRTDRRSGEAVERMVAAGFTDVVHLDGGIQAWTSAGKPVVQGSGNPAAADAGDAIGEAE